MHKCIAACVWIPQQRELSCVVVDDVEDDDQRFVELRGIFIIINRQPCGRDVVVGADIRSNILYILYLDSCCCRMVSQLASKIRALLCMKS